MKHLFSLIAGICLSSLACIAQTINHPVLEKVQVMYKTIQSVSSASLAVAAPQIKVKCTTAVTLKNGYDASKIYLSIKDKQSQAIVYQVDYIISSADVNDNGLIVYKKQGDVLYITNPNTVTLKPYVYELYTEDTAGNKSVVYSIIQ